MLISHHKYECAVIVFFTDVMTVHMVNDCITSRPLSLRARLLEQTHVSQMAQIKLARDSFSVCVFLFVCLFVFMGLICIFIYLFIYLFISLIYYYWFITQLNACWKLEIYMANWLLPVMAPKNLIN